MWIIIIKKKTIQYKFRTINYNSYFNNILNHEEHEKKEISKFSTLFSNFKIWLTGAKRQLFVLHITIKNIKVDLNVKFGIYKHIIDRISRQSILDLDFLIRNNIF